VSGGRPARGAVLGRIAAGFGGGYAVAAVAAWALTGTLPGPRIEASTAAGLIAYGLFVAFVVWSFVPRRGWVVWAVLATTVAGFALIGMVTA
jgi:hypothetical protein